MKCVDGATMSRVVLCLVSAALYGSSIAAQQSGASGGGQGGGPVSSTVFAIYEASVSEADGRTNLDLLILWRGSKAGWFDGMSQEGGATGSARVHRLRFAGRIVELHVDTGKQTVRIQGQTIALDGANVILIDDVDARDGVTVRTSFLSDPSFPGIGRDTLQRLIQRSPELVEFARLEPN
jgi:hypothetical protein